MSSRNCLFALMLLMAAVAVMAASFTMVVLYRAAFEERRASLAELAKSQARTIASVTEQFAEMGLSSNQVDHAIQDLSAALTQRSRGLEHRGNLYSDDVRPTISFSCFRPVFPAGAAMNRFRSDPNWRNPCVER